MQILQIRNVGNEYQIMKDDSLVYSGSYQHASGTTTVSIKNALNEVFLTLLHARSGFKLFGGNKPKTFQIDEEGIEGSLSYDGTCYLWKYCEFAYYMYIGTISGKRAMIMRDNHKTLAGILGSELQICDPQYSAVMVAFYIYLMENKELHEDDPFVFEKQWEAWQKDAII